MEIRPQRLFARMDGDFVVFLIGMRINKPWLIHKWWPVAMAMPRMIRELRAQPALGLLGAEMWGGRTTIMLQYWRSFEQLFAYSKNRDSQHLPAWRDFNRSVGVNGEVGIWHETYLVSPGRYENIYVNMPVFGLGRAGTLGQAHGPMHSGEARLQAGAARVDSRDDQ